MITARDAMGVLPTLGVQRIAATRADELPPNRLSLTNAGLAFAFADRQFKAVPLVQGRKLIRMGEWAHPHRWIYKGLPLAA